MRRHDASTHLSEAEAAAADRGVKGMIPIARDPAQGPPRPFLDYVVSGLADVGVTDVVLVIGPEHDAMRTYYGQEAPPARVRVRFAVQDEALGTANAVIAAADVVGEQPFLVLNADNYYPREALQRLVDAGVASTIAFDRETLVREGNIEPERVRAFAVLDIASDGSLRQLIEKPGDRIDLNSDAARWVGMNCWIITPALVDACRRVPRSARGEYELPEAVALALAEGVSVQAPRLSLPVFDLSHRADIATLAARLATLDPHP